MRREGKGVKGEKGVRGREGKREGSIGRGEVLVEERR